MKYFLILFLILGSAVVGVADDAHPLLKSIYRDPKFNGDTHSLLCDYVEKTDIPRETQQSFETVYYWAHIVGDTPEDTGFVIVGVRSNMKRAFELKYGLSEGPSLIPGKPKKLEGQLRSDSRDFIYIYYQR